MCSSVKKTIRNLARRINLEPRGSISYSLYRFCVANMSPALEYLISNAIKARGNPNVVSYKNELLLQLKVANDKEVYAKCDVKVLICYT